MWRRTVIVFFVVITNHSTVSESGEDYFNYATVQPFSDRRTTAPQWMARPNQQGQATLHQQ